MTGAKLKNKAHLQALPLRVFPAEHNCASESVMDGVTSRVKMFRDRETRQILLYASKVLAKTLSCRWVENWTLDVKEIILKDGTFVHYYFCALNIPLLTF